eukprot:Protomagalhaensia_sp_Gyna_25__754@NODE_1361_length_1908_cov_5_883895_g1093_i0_p1_GENE_NODE_1361_length_1908_cov_5_883895_g1093_i0NODE_1361_length_1908_cov_5_883895_g1093_i0_p1_ORF_typecomplete_len396_score54_82zfC5HC2/PF02928_16/0_73zfC5HC2/PF02928_16/4_5e02_NODE_1361_length_1908_cov_5_883895_g1093_i06291816
MQGGATDTIDTERHRLGHFLSENHKVMADLVSLMDGSDFDVAEPAATTAKEEVVQNPENSVEDNPNDGEQGAKPSESSLDQVIYNERMRYMDLMSLLASLPAPSCSLCNESLYLSCITCHHRCLSTQGKNRLSSPPRSAPVKRKHRAREDTSITSSVSSEDVGQRSPVIERTPRRPRITSKPPVSRRGSFVCVNCRSKFTCSLTGEASCRGVLLLSRFSLSQIAILMVILTDRIRTVDVVPPIDLPVAATRQLSIISQTTASVIRHIHRIPRLSELTELNRIVTLRVHKWNSMISKGLHPSNKKETPSNNRLADSSSSGSESLSNGRITSSHSEPNGQSSQQPVNPDATTLVSVAGAPHGVMNQSLMTQLSPVSLGIVNSLSWIYMATAPGRIVG